MAKYEYKTKIRYNEVDKEGFLTPLALIDLFQTTSTFQSEELGNGVSVLQNAHRAWVLSSWQIVMNSMPRFMDDVIIETWSYGIKSALGYRNFALLDADRNMLVAANSLWVFIDTDTGKPVKPSEETIRLYGSDPKIEMDYAPRRITLNESMIQKEPFEVKYYFIDTNNHMNNEKYILAATEYLPENVRIHEIRAEYKKQARLGEVITPMYYADGNTITVAMYDHTGDHNATIQFILN